MMGPALRRPALIAAAVLLVGAIFLPLWGMTLWSIQFPDGLRMIVFATHVAGDLNDLNALNHYIGMLPISSDFFPELTILPAIFLMTAAVCTLVAFLRLQWGALAPLFMLAGTAVYGMMSMQKRLYQFGHELDPTAAITIEPFTPPALGEHQIAQFATYSYFGVGTGFAVTAGILVAFALYLDMQNRT